jgi:hypothetical protein
LNFLSMIINPMTYYLVTAAAAMMIISDYWCLLAPTLTTSVKMIAISSKSYVRPHSSYYSSKLKLKVKFDY